MINPQQELNNEKRILIFNGYIYIYIYIYISNQSKINEISMVTSIQQNGLALYDNGEPKNTN